MFLRNFDNAMVAAILRGDYSATNSGTSASVNGTSIFGDGYANARRPDGSTTNCNIKILMSAGTVGGICLGNGSTPVTYEDYKLSGSVVPNKLILVSETSTYNEGTKKWRKSIKATYNNSGSTDITISEWGFFVMSPSMSPTAYVNSGQSHILLSREVLDEPIVIEAGTTATLTFNIDVPAPNHP